MKLLNKIQASALNMVSMLAVALLMVMQTIMTMAAVAVNSAVNMAKNITSLIAGNVIAITADVLKISSHIVHLAASIVLSKAIGMMATKKVKKSKSFKALEKTLKNLNKKVK